MKVMKQSSLALACLGGLCLLPGVGAAGDAPASKAQVVATVSTFRNKSGFLGCRLYKSPAGFPERSKGTIERRVPIGGGLVSCTFEDLDPGTYAVSVLHDENGNRRLDKNLFGIPIEGYGVSNNHTHAFSPPTWDDSKFVVSSGKKVSLAIQLRY